MLNKNEIEGKLLVNKHELILVIGQSGAGRTTVIHILDDQGFDTLDNVPIHLIPQVASTNLEDKPLAIGLDLRSKSFSLQKLMREINNWKTLSKSRVVILFLECSLEILIKRFSLSSNDFSAVSLNRSDNNNPPPIKVNSIQTNALRKSLNAKELM